MFKTPEHFKDSSYLPKTPRFTLASKTTAILIIKRKKSSKVRSKVSPVVQSSPVNTNTHINIVLIYFLCMIKFRVRWCTRRMWTMLLSCVKLIGLFLFCLFFSVSTFSFLFGFLNLTYLHNFFFKD